MMVPQVKKYTQYGVILGDLETQTYVYYEASQKHKMKLVVANSKKEEMYKRFLQLGNFPS